MIIRAEELKEISKKILAAVDSHELSAVTETLEILVDNRVFSLSVTNREYFAKKYRCCAGRKRAFRNRFPRRSKGLF